MTLSMLGFVVNDAFIKKAVEDLELFQAVVIRGSIVVLLLGSVSASRRQLGTIRNNLHPAIGIRVVMETTGTVLYLLALSNLPLASVTAVLQIVPLAVTFVAARLLREKVDIHRVGAVIVGFLGVVLVVQPGGDSFSPWFFAAFAGMATVVVREMATIRVPNSVPSTVLALITAVTITVMGVLVSIWQGWAPITGNSIVLLVAAAASLSVAYTSSVVAIRTGDISFTAPFRYSILVFAIVMQIIVFGEVPDLMTFIGAGVVAVAGFYVLSREPRVVAPATRG
jgi:drug/metabolite transporter (DMT)-like permease